MTNDTEEDAPTPSVTTRRHFLKNGAAASLVAGAGYGSYRLFFGGMATFDTSQLPQGGSLPIPPLLEDQGSGIELVARSSSTEFIAGAASTTWGFNQGFLGPTIRVRRGQTVPFSITNELDEVITSHWHGLHIPGVIDGGPFNLIEPSQAWEFEMDVAQQASTNWYHSHVHGSTGRQVIMGLAGMFLIEDDNSDALDLPSTYGVDDIPLIVQDRTFLSDGSMFADIGGGVFLGETLVVNGAIDPDVELQAKRNRLRILNGANGRLFEFFMSDGSPLVKVASEGGFLNSPVDVESLFLSPGERAEVIVDLSNHAVGDVLVLRSVNVNGDGGMDDEFDVLRITVTEALLANPELATVLNEVPLASELVSSVDVVAERDFVLRQNAINGVAFDHAVVNHVSQVGTWELWNLSGGAHPFHVHGASFLVTARNGREPSPEDAGWRDTVFVGNGTQVLVRFDHEAPAEATYMYHCHLMGHEDAGMMGQFAVVENPEMVADHTAAAAPVSASADASTWYCDLTTL